MSRKQGKVEQFRLTKTEMPDQLSQLRRVRCIQTAGIRH